MKGIRNTALGLCLSVCTTMAMAGAPDDAALSAAIEARDHAAVASLLKAADAPPGCNLDSLFSLPLTAAMGNNDLRAVQLLLDAGACKGQLERFTLFLNDKGKPAMLEALLDHGLSPNALQLETPMLATAARDSHLEALQLLLARGASVQLADKKGNTALMLATTGKREHRAAIVDLLLARGTDVQARNAEGQTALHWAARQGDGAMLKLLQARGLSMTDRDQAGVSAYGHLYSSRKGLALAEEYPLEKLDEADRLHAISTGLEDSELEVVERLLRPGEVRAHPEWLRRAREHTDLDVLAWLLANGADPSLADSHGRPLFLRDIEQDEGESLLASRMLVAAGARFPAKIPADEWWLWLDGSCLRKAACLGWLRLAGLSPKTRIGDSDTLASISRQTDEPLIKPALWQKPLPPALSKLKPTFGAAWRARRAELVGTWSDAEGENLWSFAADGSVTAKISLMFVEDRSRGRWEQTDTGLHLRFSEHSSGAMLGESSKPTERRMTALLWLGNELTVVDSIGRVTLKKIDPKPRDLAGPSITSLTPEAACNGAGERLTKATTELREFLALAENKEPTPQRQGLEKLASLETPAFVAECRRDYETKPEIKRFTQCLLTTDTWLSMLACVGMAQEAVKP